MIFLNPAILFGLLASSIPVLIHLLNLRKLKKVEFSTLSFLKELQKTKIRRIKLKQWILLVLRVLIILFLVLSFARPALETVSFGVGSSAKTTAVIILDNSFSMSAVDENGSLINQAKAAVKNLLTEFNDGDEIVLITTSETGSPDINSSNIKLVSESIDNIESSSVSSDIDEAVEQAYNIISGSQNFNKEIYIISDFQSSRFFKNRSTLFSGDITNAKVYFMPMADDNFTNLAITSFDTENQIFELNKNISFKSNVTNYSVTPLNNNVLSLFINGKRSAQRSFDIDPGETVQVEFETTLNASGLLSIFAELEEDDIINDNRRYINIYVPENIRTLLLTDRQGDGLFVETALKGSKENYFIIDKDLSTRINSYNLFEYEVVFLIGSNYSGNMQKIEQYLESGGSIIIMPGSEESGFGNVCRQLGINEPEALIANENKASYSSIDKIDYSHPVFSDLFENKKKQFESPEIYKYLKLFNSGKGRSIMSQIDGSLFMGEFNSGEGKILLFTVAPTLNWSNFPIKGIFAPLINKSVFYLVSANRSSNDYIAGDELVVEASKADRPQIRVVKPDNTQEYIQPELKGFNNSFNYSESDQPGIYKFYSNEKLFDYISVNVDLRESDLAFAESDEVVNKLSSVMPGADIIELEKNSNISEKISQARFGTELWKPFLIIVLLLALIEMWLAKSSRKDIAELS